MNMHIFYEYIWKPVYSVKASALYIDKCIFSVKEHGGPVRAVWAVTIIMAFN